MKSTTTYLEEIRKDIENVQTKEELDAKYIQWCQNFGRDVVTFFPDLTTNEEGQKWLRIIGENFAEVFNTQAEKISKRFDKRNKTWYNKDTKQKKGSYKMKTGYVAIDDYEVIAAGVDEEAVKAWVFDFVVKDYDQTEIDEILADLDYQNLDDLRMDMVYRGYPDFWDYLGIDFEEAAIIGAD